MEIETVPCNCFNRMLWKNFSSISPARNKSDKIDLSKLIGNWATQRHFSALYVSVFYQSENIRICSVCWAVLFHSRNFMKWKWFDDSVCVDGFCCRYFYANFKWITSYANKRNCKLSRQLMTQHIRVTTNIQIMIIKPFAWKLWFV